MGQSFPTSVPSYADTTGSEVLGSAGGGLGLSRILDDYGLDITGLATKLGTGDDTAAANQILVGTGSGTSAWQGLTSVELRSILSDETGSGLAVFATNPVFIGADLNGTKLILDADADTSITADTDDQIDVEISGADDFRFTANTFTALSGSTIATNTIAETTAASGVTIDGLLIKDSKLATDNSVVTTNITDGSVTPNKLDLDAAAGFVTTSETTTSTSFADLATTTDTASVVVGANGVVLVVVSAFISNNGANSSSIGIDVSGANTVAADDNRSLLHIGTSNEGTGAPFLYTGLSVGSTAFKLKYKVSAGTGTFQHRRIGVIPL